MRHVVAKGTAFAQPNSRWYPHVCFRWSWGANSCWLARWNSRAPCGKWVRHVVELAIHVLPPRIRIRGYVTAVKDFKMTPPIRWETVVAYVAASPTPNLSRILGSKNPFYPDAGNLTGKPYATASPEPLKSLH